MLAGMRGEGVRVVDHHLEHDTGRHPVRRLPDLYPTGSCREDSAREGPLARLMFIEGTTVQAQLIEKGAKSLGDLTDLTEAYSENAHDREAGVDG